MSVLRACEEFLKSTYLGRFEAFDEPLLPYYSSDQTCSTDILGITSGSKQESFFQTTRDLHETTSPDFTSEILSFYIPETWDFSVWNEDHTWVAHIPGPAVVILDESSFVVKNRTGATDQVWYDDTTGKPIVIKNEKGASIPVIIRRSAQSAIAIAALHTHGSSAVAANAKSYMKWGQWKKKSIIFSSHTNLTWEETKRAMCIGKGTIDVMGKPLARYLPHSGDCDTIIRMYQSIYFMR